MSRPPQHSRPPMASDAEILVEVEELVSDGQVDAARPVLEDARRSRPSGAELVQRRRALEQVPDQPASKSGVVERRREDVRIGRTIQP